MQVTIRLFMTVWKKKKNVQRQPVSLNDFFGDGFARSYKKHPHLELGMMGKVSLYAHPCTSLCHMQALTLVDRELH